MSEIKIYDSGFRGECPKEVMEQITFVNIVRKTYPNITHIRNEGSRTFNQAAKQKAEGMVKGASDIIIPASPAFVCEFKRKDKTKSKVSKEQMAYLEQSAALGAFSCVAYGYEQALLALKDWEKIINK